MFDPDGVESICQCNHKEKLKRSALAIKYKKQTRHFGNDDLSLALFFDTIGIYEVAETEHFRTNLMIIYWNAIIRPSALSIAPI